MVALTIGMATYDDFDGVYFTLQALRLYQNLDDTELLVVDNFGCDHTRRFIEDWAKARYVRATELVGTAAPRERVFAEARGEAVLCCDSHVLFAPDAIARLRAYYRENPDTIDLLQGPILADDLETVRTHMEPVWRDEMWGVWATDPRGEDPEGEAFEIPMQGLGAFSCRRDAWPGFHPAFRGFGGEEGYLHEKVRQRGGRCLCLPWLRWGHRFGRPRGVPYPVLLRDKVKNYIVGFDELGLDLAPIRAHFAARLPGEKFDALVREALPDKLLSQFITPTSAATEEEVAALPLVSCICPTYGRPPSYQHLIEEAIESFLRQTYPNKELIVLNDCPEQELVCAAAGVRVVNVTERFPTLGDKYNAAIALARGDLIAPWEDDDISLPWRLSLSVEALGDADYFNPRRYWFLDGNGLHFDHGRGYGHNLSLFTRAAFDAVGGYPAISGAQDAEMDSALRSRTRWVNTREPGREELPRSEWFYIYRWGVSPSHLSGHSSPEKLYRQVGSQPTARGRFVLRPHWHKDYVAETRRLIEADVPSPAASAADSPLPVAAMPTVASDKSAPTTGRRAMVCFVEENSHLIQQLLALRLSWLYSQSLDTDLVVMGPESVLDRLPDDLVKIAQQPAADDPVWGGYRSINAIACLNGAGAEQLDRYSHLLHTDVDAFITPAWNAFAPAELTFGSGGYANDEDVRRRIRDVAATYGLTHRGISNVGATWYGPTGVVRRAAALTEMLTKHLLTQHFAHDPGAWPGWYRGVALRYAGEIAVNHCAPDARRSALLDAPSTSAEPVERYAHIHCWHTRERFSKHAFMAGDYAGEDLRKLNMTITKNYCLALSMLALEELAPVP